MEGSRDQRQWQWLAFGTFICAMVLLIPSLMFGEWAFDLDWILAVLGFVCLWPGQPRAEEDDDVRIVAPVRAVERLSSRPRSAAAEIAGPHPLRFAVLAFPPGFGTAQLKRHRGHHDAGTEQQPALEPKSRLVVQ